MESCAKEGVAKHKENEIRRYLRIAIGGLLGGKKGNPNFIILVHCKFLEQESELNSLIYFCIDRWFRCGIDFLC